MEMLQMRLRIEALEKRIDALEGKAVKESLPAPVEPKKPIKKPAE